LFEYDWGEKLKAVSRLPATWFCRGRVTGETVTVRGTEVLVASATTTIEPSYVPGVVP
jgi:hypothetical protein